MKSERSYRCPRCGQTATEEKMRENLYQCAACAHLFPMPPIERIRMLSDGRAMKEFHGELTSQDPLHFPDYRTKIENAFCSL